MLSGSKSNILLRSAGLYIIHSRYTTLDKCRYIEIFENQKTQLEGSTVHETATAHFHSLLILKQKSAVALAALKNKLDT